MSGTYKLFSGAREGDLYLLRREAGDTIKVSLHASGLWKVDHDGRGRGSSVPSRCEWRPPAPDSEGKRLAIVIYVAAELVVDQPTADDAKILWASLPKGHATMEFQVWLVQADRPVAIGPGMGWVGVLELGPLGQAAAVVAIPRREPAPKGSMTIGIPDGVDVHGFADRVREASPHLMWFGADDGGPCAIVDGFTVGDVQSDV